MLSYAGVPLSVASPELAAHVERTVSPRDVFEFERLLWPGARRTTWAFPGQLADRGVKVNTLFWPQGASRWAVGHFLATDSQLAAIRSQVYAGSGGYQSRPLVLTWENAAGVVLATVSTDLWLLPARPLFQPADGRGLWLLTLVDDRYFWWEQSSGDLEVADGVTYWEDVYSAIGQALGLQVFHPPAQDAYLKPSGSLTSRYEPLPLLLDAVAYNLGQRVCRRLTGTVLAEAYPDSLRGRALNLRDFPAVQAGGRLALAPGQPNDLLPLLPGAVQLAFPREDDGTLTCDVHAVTVTFNSLSANLPDLPIGVNNSRAKVFHDTCVARFVGGVLQNGAELLALAQQAATDWYRWQTGLGLDLDLVLAGVVPWAPSGLDDSVEWTYRPDKVSTRVQRRAWNDRVEQLAHCGAAGSYPSEPPGCPAESGGSSSLEIEYEDDTGTVPAVEQLRFPKDSYTVSSPGAHVARVDPVWGSDGFVNPIGAANHNGDMDEFARVNHQHRLNGLEFVDGDTPSLRVTLPVDLDGGATIRTNPLVVEDDGAELRTRGPLFVEGQMHWEYASYSLTGTVDDWDPVLHRPVYRLTPTAETTVSGMKPPQAAKVRMLWNVGEHDLILKHNAATLVAGGGGGPVAGESTAGNGFYCPEAHDVRLQPNDFALLEYDGIDQCWRVLIFSSLFGSYDVGQKHRGMVPSTEDASSRSSYLAASGDWVQLVNDPSGNVTHTFTRASGPERLLVKGVFVPSGDADDDKYVKVDADDTTADYLAHKLVAGTNVTILTSTDPGTGAKDMIVQADDRRVAADGTDLTPGTLQDKLYAPGNGVKLTFEEILGDRKAVVQLDHELSEDVVIPTPDGGSVTIHFLYSLYNGYTVTPP